MSQPPEQPYPTQGATLQQLNLPEEEIPTQRTPRFVMPTQQSSPQEMTDGRAADPAADEIDETPTQRIRRIKTPTQQSPTKRKPTHQLPTLQLTKPTRHQHNASDESKPQHSSHPHKTRPTHEPPTLQLTRPTKHQHNASAESKPRHSSHPHKTRPTHEPPTLQLTRLTRHRHNASDGSKPQHSSHPHKTRPTDQRADHAAVEAEKVDPAPDGSEDADTVEMPSVLAVFSGGRDPAADTEKTDGQKQDPTAAQTENADTPPAGPDDADPLEKPPVRPVVRAGGDPSPRPEQQVVGPVPTRNPARNKRLVSAGLAAIALSAALVGALSVSSRDAGELTAQSVATDTATASTTASKPTSGASTGSTDTESDESTIQVKGLAASARPFQTVRIQGKYPGRADTYLRVQHWDEGAWLAFPLPTKTDQSGKFTAYVELEQPGRYPLRVVDPNSGTTSKTFVILIES